jgi:pyruvate dehydrogenase E1 component
MAQDKLASFEPAFVDELALCLRWGFAHMQAPEGGAVYLRLSTRSLEQPQRALTRDLEHAIVAGAYWARPPTSDADLAIVYVGAVAPEAMAAAELLAEDVPGIGVLAVTSIDRLHADWRARGPASHIARLLGALAPGAALVTILDGHPAALSWLGAVKGQRIRTLGVDHFGQSGDLPDLYRAYGLDAEAIVDAAARALVDV